jgi:hypothetical protein
MKTALALALLPMVSASENIETRTVSWSDALRLSEALFPSGDAQNPGPARAVILGNFKDNWEVTFPLVSDEVRALPNIGSLKQSLTFAYNVFDQTLTYSACPTSGFDLYRDSIFQGSVQAYQEYWTSLDINIDTNVLVAQNSEDKCFDNDIAGENVDTYQTTFGDYKTLGYRIRIHESKTCDTELPHIAVYGKNTTVIDNELASEPNWDNLVQTSYDPTGMVLNTSNTNVYDVYVNYSHITPGADDGVEHKLIEHEAIEKGAGMQADDRVVRISLNTQSDHVLENSNDCAFTIEKIYVGDVVYQMQSCEHYDGSQAYQREGCCNC